MFKIPCEWSDCKEWFLDLSDLVTHLNEHIGFKKGEYSCEWAGCNRKGVSQTSRFSLIAHVRSHTGERPFDCPIPECDKSFTRSDALAKHQKQHTEYKTINGSLCRTSQIKHPLKLPFEFQDDDNLPYRILEARLAYSTDQLRRNKAENDSLLYEYSILRVQRDLLLEAVIKCNKEFNDYKRAHFFLGIIFGSKTALIASSNTVFNPFCVRAEHSRYLTAVISLPIARPC